MTDLMQYADVIKQKDQHDEGFQRSLIVVKGYLVDVENTGTPLVSARPGFVWVREYGANGGVFQAFLSPKVQARVELPVLIMYNPVKPFLRQVIDVDWSEMVNYEDFDDQPLLGLHAQDHEWPDFTPGADPVNIYLRALVPLKTFPNVGLTVRMAPFVYEVDNEVREYFGETSIDISEHQPASGEAVYVLTYFDVEANAAASVAGTAVADSPTITPNIPDVPENAYQSALVRLDGDQTSFAETDIKDIRKLYEISKTSSIRGATLLDVAVAVGEVDYVLSDHIVNHPVDVPAGTDGQLQYNNGGVFGGSGAYWDDANSRLGIGTATPATTLDVVGVGAFSTGLYLGTTSAPLGGSPAIHISGPAPGFFFTDTSAADNNLLLVFDAALMQFQNRTDAGAVSSAPFIIDLTSATNTFRINSSRVGIGSDPTNVSAKLEISGTTGALLLPRLTTTQQNALTAVNGMLIYNSTTAKFTGYAAGAWVALH